MGTFNTGIPSSLRSIPYYKSTQINIRKVFDENNIIYGSLYNGYAVNDTRKIANTGWRVPTIDDFAPLSAIAADTSPFSPSAIGYRTTTFVALDTTELVWGIGGIDMAIDIPSGISTETSPYNSGYNVRLLKNATTLLDGQTGTYVGNDGVVYNTICIGSQEWLSENLIETKYRNGDIIPNITDDTLWIDSTSGAMCYYNNMESNSHTHSPVIGNPVFHIDVVGDNGYSAIGVPITRTQPLRFNNLKYGTYTITEQSVLGYTSSVLPATVVLSAETPMWDVVVNNTVVDYNRLLRLTFNEDVTGGGIEVNYGSLYNWYTATDARGIAPSGWHVPSYAEWQTLATTLGGIGVAGGKMKEAGTTHWSAPNTGADNSSGFNALPAGTRTTGFQNINISTVYNSTTALSPYNSATEFLSYVNDDFSVGFSSYTFGCSIRLIKDNSTDTGTVTDYDGNIYPTVKIGTQVWMAENLIVEHFNNGDAIPNVTDDTAWGALATSGMCYYDNDVTNSYIYTSDAVSTYIGGDATLLSSWNTFFNLPTNGHEFTSISIDGGIVSLNSLGDVETKINQFLNCTLLTNVYDNGVIIYLGSNTFNGCSNLITTSIAKCASIDEYAFYYCQAMTTAYLPIASTMAQYAFYGCKWLSSLDIPYYAYTSIEPYVFTGCESITSFRFDNVTNVSEGAFANCHATSYIIPSLTTAGISAFASNPVITSYDFHSLTTAGNWCFYQNDANTAIDFANLTTAGEYCWAANYLVTSVMLPNITTAGKYCFSYLYNVPTFNLGKLVTAGEGAFNNCYLATLFYLPLLTSIGTRGFYGAYACNTVYIPLCTSLGATVGDNLVFYNVAALSIGITIPYMLMTCNSGSPDGDLQYLMANNTVSIQYSDALTVDSTIVTSDKTTYTI